MTMIRFRSFSGSSAVTGACHESRVYRSGAISKPMLANMIEGLRAAAYGGTKCTDGFRCRRRLAPTSGSAAQARWAVIW